MISAEGDAAQRALGGVVPEADPAVFEKPGECRPALQHVVHRLGEVVAARQLGPLLPQPALRIGDQGYAQLLPGSPAPTLTEEMLLRIERAELLAIAILELLSQRSLPQAAIHRAAVRHISTTAITRRCSSVFAIMG